MKRLLAANPTVGEVQKAFLPLRPSAKPLLLIFWVGLFACAVAGCVQGKRANEVRIDQEKVGSFLNQARYQAALDEFAGFDWGAIQAPGTVKLFCGALVGSGREKLPDDFVSKAPTNVSAFAQGYLLLLTGKTQSAMSMFETLEKDAGESQKIWAELGLLEVGAYTENLLFSIEPLRALNRLIADNASSELKEELRFFQANYSLRSGDFPNVGKILLETKWSHRQVDAKVMQMQLLLRGNLFDEMSALLEHNQSPRLLDFKVMRGRLTLLKEGAEQYERQLQALNAKFANNVDIQLDLLSNKIFRGAEDEKASALEALATLLKKEQSDFPISLYAANLLFEFGTPEIRETVKRTIGSAPEPPINFSRFYLLETKIYRQSKQYAAAKKSFEQAVAMAPANLEILREGYLLAIDSGASSEARRILKRSLAVEPYAVDVAMALADLDVTLGNLAEAKELVAGLKANRRYIDPGALSYISSRLSQEP